MFAFDGPLSIPSSNFGHNGNTEEAYLGNVFLPDHGVKSLKLLLFRSTEFLSSTLVVMYKLDAGVFIVNVKTVRAFVSGQTIKQSYHSGNWSLMCVHTKWEFCTHDICRASSIDRRTWTNSTCCLFSLHFNRESIHSLVWVVWNRCDIPTLSLELFSQVWNEGEWGK